LYVFLDVLAYMCIFYQLANWFVSIYQ